jgi:hypothetical protein
VQDVSGARTVGTIGAEGSVTVLASGTVNLNSGLNQSANFPVPGGIKQPGVPLGLRISWNGDSLPTGNTTISVFLSFDGAVTWKSASVTATSPRVWKTADHTLYLGFSMGANDNPTHARYEITAPSAFSLPATLETA